MTFQTSSFDRTYVYAQSLDNSGKTDCWVLSENGKLKKIDTSTHDMNFLLDTIDAARTEGRNWSIGNKNIVFYVLLSGACVVRVKPLTLDVSGRLSYIQIVTNCYSKNRFIAVQALANLSEISGRETDGGEIEIAKKFKKILQLPRWLIFIHVVLFSRRFSND
jgi:hypothetical protein